MATAGEQIEAALRLIGFLGEGETPSGTIGATCLETLNQMLEAWSVSRLLVYSTQDQALTWTAGNATRTLGPTGQLVGLRPVQLLPDTYYTVGSQSYPIRIISREEYNAIPNKAASSSLPEFLVIDYDSPNTTLTLYPVPSQNLAFHFISVTEFTQPALYTTELALPPGYLRAVKYNLAVELASEFGTEAKPSVQRIASTSMRALKRANVRPEDMVLTLPYPIAHTTSRILTDS
jgi:hypothetical protein